VHLVVGFASATDGFDGSVDAFTINSTTYDFEPNLPPVNHTVITCTAFGGGPASMTFRPPLTYGGTNPEVAFLRADLGKCSVSGGKAPRDDFVTLHLNVSSNNCAGTFADDANTTNATNTETMSWKPRKNNPKTIVHFPGTTATTTGSGSGEQLKLSFGGPGTSASGSFVGNDNGASSTATFVTTGSNGNALAVGCTKGTKIGKVALGFVQITDG
jgi:hypothetical protein